MFAVFWALLDPVFGLASQIFATQKDTKPDRSPPHRDSDSVSHPIRALYVALVWVAVRVPCAIVDSQNGAHRILSKI